MIQIISNNIDSFSDYSNEKFKISYIDDFDSFDNHTINVIDLSGESLWRNSSTSDHNIINRISDLQTLSKEIKTMKKSKIVIVFPQNCYYRYKWSVREQKYGASIKLKDMLIHLTNIISQCLIDIKGFEITYSKNLTSINNVSFKSDFNLNQIFGDTLKIINKSDNSDKITTAEYNNTIITTLDIFESSDHLENFLNYLLNNEEKETSEPEWVNDINFFDDQELKIEKQKNNEKIKSIEDKNLIIDKRLNNNRKFKSVLYTSGDELVKIVMHMLDDMLKNDSSSFVDEKKEDFLIRKPDITFVGEIKGISSAIGNKQVSQLDVHVQEYNDKLIADGISENVKGLMIINHQRNKPINDRNEIHQNQIDLAIRNKSLIIETKVLLYLYEQFLQKKVEYKTIIKVLSDKTGILLCEDIEG